MAKIENRKKQNPKLQQSELSDGRASLYLEYYIGRTETPVLDENGEQVFYTEGAMAGKPKFKIKHTHKKENLNLYIWLRHPERQHDSAKGDSVARRNRPSCGYTFRRRENRDTQGLHFRSLYRGALVRHKQADLPQRGLYHKDPVFPASENKGTQQLQPGYSSAERHTHPSYRTAGKRRLRRAHIQVATL